MRTVTAVFSLGMILGCTGKDDAAVQAPATAKPMQAQTPNTAQLLLAPSLAQDGRAEAEVARDFDGDGVLELAMVILSTADNDAKGDGQLNHDRTLVMGIREGARFRSVQSSNCLALCTTCGGVWGDPFGSIFPQGTGANHG